MPQQSALKTTSACAVFDCAVCNHLLRGRCGGCAEGNALLKADGGEQCAIYACANSREIASCSDCTEAVCQFTRNLEMVCPVRSNYEKKRCYSRKLSEYFMERQFREAESARASKVPEKTITRLRWYLFALDDYLTHGITRVSSEDISRKVGIKAHLIRRDLSQFGEFGRPSIGYDAAFLRSRLADVLHINDINNIVWVGASFLKSNTGLLERFAGHRFNVVAVCDTDPAKTDGKIGDLDVLPLSDVSKIMRESNVQGAVLAVSQAEAQSVVDILVAIGITGILNLTSAIVVAPPTVCIRNVDIVAELFAMCYYCHELSGED